MCVCVYAYKLCVYVYMWVGMCNKDISLKSVTMHYNMYT